MQPSPGTSSGTSIRPAKEGRLRTVMRSALPSRHSARIRTRPPGASSTISVTGSIIGRMPLSSSTVATQIELEPDIGGVSSGSMMMKPICASGCFGGTSRLTWRKTPPRGSLSMKSRRVPSRAIHVRCSQSVAPGGGATPPTITSPTSPSAWHETTWIVLLERMGCFPDGVADASAQCGGRGAGWRGRSAGRRTLPRTWRTAVRAGRDIERRSRSGVCPGMMRRCRSAIDRGRARPLLRAWPCPFEQFLEA